MVLVDRREFWLDCSGSGPVLLVDVEAAGWNVWESLQQQDAAGPNWERCFSGWFLSGEPNQTGRAAATRPWLKCDLWPQSSSWISNAADELFDWPGPVRFCSFWMWAGVVLMLRRQPSEVHHPGRIGPVLLSTFGPGGRFWRARRPPVDGDVPVLYCCRLWSGTPRPTQTSQDPRTLRGSEPNLGSGSEPLCLNPPAGCHGNGSLTGRFV